MKNGCIVCNMGHSNTEIDVVMCANLIAQVQHMSVCSDINVQYSTSPKGNHLEIKDVFMCTHFFIDIFQMGFFTFSLAHVNATVG